MYGLPGSTTKIMTALLALEYFNPDEIIQVGEESNLTWTSERMNVQKAGLFYGQELSMKELLYYNTATDLALIAQYAMQDP